MKRLGIIALLIVTVLWGCEKGTDSYGNYQLITIDGTLNNNQQQDIILYKLGGLRPEAIDTADMEGNTFKLEVLVSDPEIYVLNIYGVHVVPLVLENADLQIEADGTDRAKLVKVSGSPAMEALTDFNMTIQDFQKKEFDVRQKYADAAIAGNQELTLQYEKESYELMDEKQELIHEKLGEMGVTLATLPALDLLDKDRYFDFVSDLSGKLTEKYPGNNDVGELAAMVKAMEPVALGKKAPAIELPDTDGQMVSLESFRGNYLLIDFWAAWCKPCRRENPNIVAAYSKYNSKGFEVLGVSLDRTKEQWVRAIEDDGLPWTQVSDLRYFNSKAAADYNVSAIPFSVLLNKEGVIIAKNLRGRKLDQKLSEIFGDS